MSLRFKNWLRDAQFLRALHVCESYLQDLTRCSLWRSKKNLLVLPEEVGKRRSFWSTLSVLFPLTKACPQGKLFYQRLTHLGEGKYPTSTPYNFFYLIGAGNRVVKKSEKHLWRSQPRSTDSLKHWDIIVGLYKTSPFPIRIITSTGSCTIGD